MSLSTASVSLGKELSWQMKLEGGEGFRRKVGWAGKWGIRLGNLD